MDPIVAVYEITLTLRAADAENVEAPTIDEVVTGVEELFADNAGVTAKASAKRSDR